MKIKIKKQKQKNKQKIRKLNNKTMIKILVTINHKKITITKLSKKMKNRSTNL